MRPELRIGDVRRAAVAPVLQRGAGDGAAATERTICAERRGAVRAPRPPRRVDCEEIVVDGFMVGPSYRCADRAGAVTRRRWGDGELALGWPEAASPAAGGRSATSRSARAPPRRRAAAPAGRSRRRAGSRRRRRSRAALTLIRSVNANGISAAIMTDRRRSPAAAVSRSPVQPRYGRPGQPRHRRWCADPWHSPRGCASAAHVERRVIPKATVNMLMMVIGSR